MKIAYRISPFEFSYSTKVLYHLERKTGWFWESRATCSSRKEARMWIDIDVEEYEEIRKGPEIIEIIIKEIF